MHMRVSVAQVPRHVRARRLAGPPHLRSKRGTRSADRRNPYLSTPITSKASILMYLPARLVGSHQILTV